MSPRLAFLSCLTALIPMALALASAGLAATNVRPVSPGDSSPVTSVAAAAALWPDLPDEKTRVQIEGVVTGTMPSGNFRLHDGELGIYVTRAAAGVPRLTPGDRVRVSGVLRQGGFSPWITPNDVVILGRGEFPVAHSATYHLLASGVADNQWLEIEGVVRAAEILEPRHFVMVDLAMMGGNLRVLVNYDGTTRFEHLIDTAVRLRGVAAVNVNKHGHVVEPTFRVPSFAEIKILQPAQPDVFSRPLVPIRGLMKSSQQARYPHRVRTSGVVTRRLSPTRFFVRDGGLGLKVETAAAADFQPGDVIEAAGFPVILEGLEALQYSVCRIIGQEPAPAPARPTIAELLEGSHNADLVSLRARLVDWVIAGQNITLVFQSGDHLIKGLLHREDTKGAVRLPEKNSLVDVTGICVIGELEDIWFYQPRSFALLLADWADLEVVQAPSWWTAKRLWWALAITGMVLVAAGGWVWALRRQVERKRGVIEQQARHAAALEERSRIARELHDTLEQGLTGLSLQMKAIENDLVQTPERVGSRLQAARQMLRHSRALARNAIRELRTELVQGRHEGLIDGLKRVANSWNHSGALTVNVHLTGKVRALPNRLEHHLLGIGTEAMTNAVKHGQADTVEVELAFRRQEVALRVKDNGTGFDPDQQLGKSSGCFGLIGMRERAREMGADIQFHSSPEQGTEVLVTVPHAIDSAASPPVASSDLTEPASAASLTS